MGKVQISRANGRDYYRNLIDVQEARRHLPEPGMRLRKTPTSASSNYTMPPCWGKVTRVNRAHLWYQVTFSGTGFRECYKWPE